MTPLPTITDSPRRALFVQLPSSWFKQLYRLPHVQFTHLVAIMVSIKEFLGQQSNLWVANNRVSYRPTRLRLLRKDIKTNPHPSPGNLVYNHSQYLTWFA